MQSFDGGDTVRILWSFDGNRNTLYSRFIMRGFDGGDLNPLPEEGLHGRLGLDYWLHGGCKNNHVKSFIIQNLLSISSLSIWLGS